ncbi:leucine zipper domain-containing protein, partial [Mesorhizobium sp.]
MSQKEEFVRLALAPGANVSALCRRFGIGRTCGHKLIARFRAEGVAGLAERSRRPKSSPRRSPPSLEAAVVS